MIYLDNAATTNIKPDSVVKAVNFGLSKLSANPGRGGHKASVNAALSVYGVREKIASYFGTDDTSSVCFTANCTTSINTVLNGVLKTNDHVIISSLEHNAVYRPICDLAKNRGIEFDVVDVDLYDVKKIVSDIEKKIKSNTKLVFITHASNVTGTLLPIKEIGELCKNRQILFGVDAAQSAGHVKINMEKDGIDFLCIAPHKGLYAPMSTGILISLDELDTVLIKGGTGVNSISEEQPLYLPERIESGTLCLPNILGIGGGIDFLNSAFYKKRHLQDIKLSRFLYRNLEKIGAVLYSPIPDDTVSVAVVSFNINGKGSEEVAKYLSDNNVAVRGGLQCAPLAHRTIGTLDKGTVRISPSCFNNFDEIEKTVFLLKKFKKIY